MSNPVLSKSSIEKALGRSSSQAGWGAPQSLEDQTFKSSSAYSGLTNPKADHMTREGTTSAAILLTALLSVAAIFGWYNVQESFSGAVIFPTWVLGAVLLGFVTGMIMRFKPKASPILAPIYAVVQGVVLGSISRVFNAEYDGIVVQAVGISIGVFIAMLTLYRTKIIQVTNKMRSTIMGATMGIMLFYTVAIVASFFGVSFSIFTSSSLLSIGFSLLVAGLAASNLLLDFDTIERGQREGYPKYMEWYCAFGVLATMVWLYLEVLRLLAKLRSR